MWALGIETQNPCGIPELQTWLGRFSDYQIGRQECHGPMGGHGDIHQKHSSRETAVSLSHWRGAWSRGTCVCVCLRTCVCANRNYFSREIIFRDSTLERAQGTLDPNFSQDKRGHCHSMQIVRAPDHSSHWLNNANTMLLVPADMMHHSEKKKEKKGVGTRE